MKIFATIGAFALLALVPAGRARAPVTLEIPGRSNENVSVAARGRWVAVAWSATAPAAGTAPAATDIFVGVSRDGGATLGAPARVNTVPGDAKVGGEQPPRVALIAGKGANPDIAVVWTTKGATGTRVVSALSVDGGMRFSPAATVPGGDGPGNRGWESIAVDSAGRVLVAWLDHRNVAPAPMHHHDVAPEKPAAKATSPKPDPVERAALSQLWVSSLDGALKPATVAGGVCYCCKTSLVASGNHVYAAWRHVYAGNQRDIAFSASDDGGHTFKPVARVSEDHWQFDGCPENGPALAVDRAGRVHVAWVTPLDGKEGAPLALYHALSVDGKTFTPRERVPTTGAAAHAQLAVGADGSLYLAWDEATAAGRRVRLARGTPDPTGRVALKEVTGATDGVGLNPALATTPSGVVVAWVRRQGERTTISVASP